MSSTMHISIYKIHQYYFFVMLIFLLCTNNDNIAYGTDIHDKKISNTKTSDTNPLDPNYDLFEKYMLNQEYEKSLDILDRVFDDKNTTPEESKGECIIKYASIVYLNLMLGREESFLKQYDDVCKKILKEHWHSAALVRLHFKNALYAKLNMPNEIIEESEQYIKNDLTELTNYQAYAYAAGALLVNENVAKAKEYLSSAEQVLCEFRKSTREKGRPMTIDDEFVILIKLLQYYIKHMTRDYEVDLVQKKPKPPIILFKQEKPELYFSVSCRFKFISKKTNEVVDMSEVLKKIQAEEKQKAATVKP